MKPTPILYAEDEENDAFFFKRAFSQVNISQPLQLANDGQEAINYCAGQGEYANRDEYPLPHLLILDLNMPRKSGLEVLQWVRKESDIPTIPVIIFTSSVHSADIRRAYLAGANAYLAKPSQPGDLVVIVQTIKDFWLNQNRSLLR